MFLRNHTLISGALFVNAKDSSPGSLHPFSFGFVIAFTLFSPPPTFNHLQHLFSVVQLFWSMWKGKGGSIGPVFVQVCTPNFHHSSSKSGLILQVLCNISKCFIIKNSIWTYFFSVFFHPNYITYIHRKSEFSFNVSLRKILSLFWE